MGRYFTPQTKDNEVAVKVVAVLDSFTNANLPAQNNTTGDIIKGYDLPEFIDDLGAFIKSYQAHTKEFKDFSFSPAYADADVSHDEGNALRYKVMKRTYGSFSQVNTPHEGVKAPKWNLYDIVEDKNNPGYKVLIYTTVYDNTLEIASWSKNYRDADRAAYKFEELMDTYGGIFRQKGLLQLRYEIREADMYREVSNYTTYGIPLRYYVRTNKVKLVYEKTLESMVIELLINNKT